MSLVPLATLLVHLRTDAEDEDADYLQGLLDAAEEQATQFCGRNFYATQADLEAAGDDAGSYATVMPRSFQQAVLLLVGHWYRNREAVASGSYSQLPLAFHSLLWPYRVSWGV